jgi:hypothetical protein
MHRRGYMPLQFAIICNLSPFTLALSDRFLSMEARYASVPSSDPLSTATSSHSCIVFTESRASTQRLRLASLLRVQTTTDNVGEDRGAGTSELVFNFASDLLG